MRRALLALPLLGGALLAGCQPDQQAEEPVQPFVFRSLELRQKDPQGRPSWEISSPEARYDQSRKLAHATELRGTVYADGQPLYRIRASRGTVFNDGEVVLLEGPTEVRRLGDDPVLIQGQRVRWYPVRGEMAVDRGPVARQNTLELTAGRAHFDFKRDRLVLEDRPLLRDRGQAALQLAVTQLTWWAASGAIEARGPVRGERRGPTAADAQQLSSPSLRGNSLQQELVLAAPVLLRAPARQAELRAQATRLDLRANRASSEQPFQARYGSLSIRGLAFALLADATTLEIPRGCDLSRPGERLTAGSCSWNWRTNQVWARGGVNLQRQEPPLSTRAAELQGRIGGADGLVVLTQPGGAVQSRIRLPAGR